MEYQIQTIAMTDGKPSCFYSTVKSEPNNMEGYKAFIDPNKGVLVSLHRIQNGKHNGLAVMWNDAGHPVELLFYVNGEKAYQVSFIKKTKQRFESTEESVKINWSGTSDNRILRSFEGKMTLDSSKKILRPGIKKIAQMLYDKGWELRKEANEVLGFENYLRS